MRLRIMGMRFSVTVESSTGFCVASFWRSVVMRSTNVTVSLPMASIWYSSWALGPGTNHGGLDAFDNKGIVADAKLRGIENYGLSDSASGDKSFDLHVIDGMAELQDLGLRARLRLGDALIHFLEVDGDSFLAVQLADELGEIVPVEGITFSRLEAALFEDALQLQYGNQGIASDYIPYGEADLMFLFCGF
jgi:hypothetical protein